MNVLKNVWNWLLSLFPKKKQPKRTQFTQEQDDMIKLVGALTLRELNASRTLRRKIKGTKFEYLLTQIMNNESK